MKPILKWTGGKSSEIKVIEQHLPKTIKRVIEPFVGGGAFFFHRENGSNILNDFNSELIHFYNLIKSPEYSEFKRRVEQIDVERKKVLNTPIFDSNTDTLYSQFENINGHPVYRRYLTRELLSKTKSIDRINKKNEEAGKGRLSEDEVCEQYRTAVIAALYYTQREIYNNNLALKSYCVQHITSWFIMRELGYSGMFRYSNSGKFNVPYGGKSYNTKCLLNKLQRIEELRAKKFFKNSVFHNGDFKDLFEKYDYFEKDDFIFLDPPYDSEFSQYNMEEDFTKQDQVRLRDVLLKTKANAMVVIKETEFIRSLYNIDFNIEEFDKSYSVNFKNRNNRKVNHLIIKNY